jgi:hypothetical protein
MNPQKVYAAPNKLFEGWWEICKRTKVDYSTFFLQCSMDNNWSKIISRKYDERDNVHDANTMRNCGVSVFTVICGILNMDKRPVPFISGDKSNALTQQSINNSNFFK